MLAAGVFHTVVLSANGILWEAGLNHYRELGLGDIDPVNRFTSVAGVFLRNPISLSFVVLDRR
jgi:hypothetical protein